MTVDIDATVPILRRATDEKRLFDAVVFEPGRVDTFGTHVEADEIETVAHLYILKLVGQAAVVGRQHETVAEGVFVVESWIARGPIEYPGGITIPVGSWILTFWVPDDAVWADILSGEITGVSFGGTGEEEPATD